MGRLLLLSLGAASSVGCGPPDGVAAEDARWVSGADLPVARQECGVVSLEGRVVVLGGFDANLTMLDTVDAYDPGNDTWEALAPMPIPLHHPNVAVIDGRLHVAGALGEGFRELGVHVVYDPLTDAWSELPQMPLDRAVGAAAVGLLDGVLHLVGGIRLNRAVALHSTFDPATERWTAMPDAPHARDHGGAAVVGGTLAVVAGRQGTLSSFVAETDRFDAQAGWHTGAPIPTPRAGVAVAVHADGWLSVLGGEGNDADPSGVFGEHERYHIPSDRWDRLSPMPSPRHGTGAAVVDEALWVPGGADVAAFGAVRTNEGWIP